MAKWQGRALQKLDQRFESARCLPSYFSPPSIRVLGGLGTPQAPVREVSLTTLQEIAASMIVGTARIKIYLPENYSLKDKRQDLKSILARVINQYHIAAAEIADHENWQRATIGVACVSSDARHANEILSKVVNFVENNLQQGGLEDYEIEILHLS